MHAGRKRFRPILMTTFALIAGMLPVAIGVGEGGEFYRPMAVAIIGGTITSTVLTLLVVPTFYDSIEVTRDSLIRRFGIRRKRWTMAGAIVLTTLEVLLLVVGFLTLTIFLFWVAEWLFRKVRPAKPVEIAAA